MILQVISNYFRFRCSGAGELMIRLGYEYIAIDVRRLVLQLFVLLLRV